MQSTAFAQQFRTSLIVFLVVASLLVAGHIWQLTGSSSEEVQLVKPHLRPPPVKPAPADEDTPNPLDEVGRKIAEQEQKELEALKADLEAKGCTYLPGIEDIFVVIKTGATEAREKLPIHFDTTLKCIPHYAVFSDLSEEINGHKVVDVLDRVSDEFKKEDGPRIKEDEDPPKILTPPWRLYKEMHEYQEQGKDITELVNTPEKVKTAWALDKWKFLPMVSKAYWLRPTAKWFMFLEADGYVVFSNLVQLVQQLPEEKPWYLGGQSWIGGTVFAHGGGGMLLSNPAMRRVSAMITSQKKEAEKMTRDEWAGDLVLAKALKTVGVEMTQSWPTFQGEKPYTLDYTDRNFCFPVVSYHHLDAEWIKFLYDFEQDWIKEQTDKLKPLRHKDTFAHFVAPYIDKKKENWDNLSFDKVVDLEEDNDNPGTCRKACEDDKDCVQWRHVTRKCRFGHVIKLGAISADGEVTSTSGWMIDRIEQWRKKQEPCRQEWITS